MFVQGGGCSGFQYGLMIEESGQASGDQVFESNGVKLFVDPISIRYLNGAEVDFVDTVTGGGFTDQEPQRDVDLRLRIDPSPSIITGGIEPSLPIFRLSVRRRQALRPNATASSGSSCGRKVT